MAFACAVREAEQKSGGMVIRALSLHADEIAHCSGLEVTYFPCREDAAGLGEIQPRNVLVRVKANDERCDTERPDSTGLRVLLLDACNVSRDVLDRYRVLDSEPVRLALYPGLVDEDTRVSRQACGHEIAMGAGVRQLRVV